MPVPTDVRRLLYTRKQSAQALNCSVATVIRLENAGRLTKVRLDPTKPTAEVRHRVSEVEALASTKR
jgi:hypothetical protein